MGSIRLTLFGGLKLCREGEEITRFPSRKAGLLLAYLTLKAEKPQPREHLIDLLWSEMDIDAGRNNLSTLLSLLRRLLEPDKLSTGTVLKADRQTITLNREAIESDVLEFDALKARAARNTDSSQRLHLLKQAAILAHEELLPGVYEDWAEEARCHYSEQVKHILHERVGLLLSVHCFEEAQADAARLLELDDCDSEACQYLMRAAAGLGHLESAFQAYDRLEKALALNFDTIPDSEITVLKERLRRDPHTFVSHQAQAKPRLPISEGVSAMDTTLPLPPEKTYASYLPNLLTRFFGREQEQSDLRDLLLHRQERLVTVLGAGGAGKTRLALQIAHQLAPNFAGHVVFVSLADIASPLLLPVLLLNTLLLPMTPGEPLERVIFALSEKPTLLILDNMEHLLNDEGAKSENPFGNNGSVFVKRLLESVPTLFCLVTSRQSLHLEGEQEYYLPPLALPTEESLAQLQACASVALYVDRAQKAKADFVLTSHNAKAVARLCRKLEGMPLAVEMAAAWIKTLPPTRMLERLERQLEVLISRRRDLPARQTSLRATCEWSYGQLPLRLRDAFARLSVFQGGWTLEAAEAIIGRNALSVMAELQERSLLLCRETAEEEPRYRMLEPLREFAAEKLQEMGEWDKGQGIHAQFFLALAQHAGGRFQSSQEQECLACLRRDQDNLRAALHWWEQNDEPTALKLLVPLLRFWRLSGNLVEGSNWCARILTLPNAQERTLSRAHALNEAGSLTALQTDYAKAKAYQQEAYAIFLDCQDRQGQISALNGLGCISVFEHFFSEAREYFQKILQVIPDVEDERGCASCYHGLGNVEMLTGNYEAARDYMECALAIRQRLQDELGSAYTQGALAHLAREQNWYEEALRHYQAVLESFHRAGVSWTVALTLQHIAHIFQKLQKWSQAACLLGATDALRASTGYRLPPAHREEQNRNIAILRSHLGANAFEKEWNQGNTITESEMVVYTVERIQSL